MQKCVSHDSLLCTKVTDVLPFGVKQLFNNKVDKVSEVTDDGLFVDPGLQGHWFISSVEGSRL